MKCAIVCTQSGRKAATLNLCRYTRCVTSSGGPSVLVDEACEAIVAQQ